MSAYIHEQVIITFCETGSEVEYFCYYHLSQTQSLLWSPMSITDTKFSGFPVEILVAAKSAHTL